MSTPPRARGTRPQAATPGSSRDRRAVSYARVSSKEQEQEGYSIPSQVSLARSYAGERELTLVREFSDVETAKQAGRAGFNEMVSFLKRYPRCRILLVEKTDRLYRNPRDWVTLDELGVEIHFIKENFIYSQQSPSSEKFVHGLKVLMAKNFIDNLSEETRKGQKGKGRAGPLALLRAARIRQRGRTRRQAHHRTRPRPGTAHYPPV